MVRIDQVWLEYDPRSAQKLRVCRYDIFADMPIRRYCWLPRHLRCLPIADMPILKNIVPICRYCRYRYKYRHTLNRNPSPPLVNNTYFQQTCNTSCFNQTEYRLLCVIWGGTHVTDWLNSNSSLQIKPLFKHKSHLFWWPNEMTQPN